MKWVEVQVCLDCALVVAVVSEQPDRGWVYVNATESKFCPRCGAAHGAVSDPKPARLRVAFWVSTPAGGTRSPGALATSCCARTTWLSRTSRRS